MAIPVSKSNEPRWARSFEALETFSNDLGVIGSWVGPRKGPYKRTQGQKEDFVLRRFVVALKAAGRLSFPFSIVAEHEEKRLPDFAIHSSDGARLGIEITEAGTENYQRWLTATETDETEWVRLVPEEPSTPDTADQVLEAISKKVTKFDAGSYQSADACDLVVYDNTCWGGFLDKQEILSVLGHPDNVLGRFRQIHFVTGETVFLDMFGSCFERVDVRRTYEIDYAGWVAEQVDKIVAAEPETFDWRNLVEELEDLGRSERRAIRSQIERLLLHLLKWKIQPEKRSPSWKHSIANAREEIYQLVLENRSIGPDLDRFAAEVYSRARRGAASEMEKDIGEIPEENPFDLNDEVLNPEFLPDTADNE